MFKVRKDYLRIILFAMAIPGLCFKKDHKYARLRKQKLDYYRSIRKHL